MSKNIQFPQVPNSWREKKSEEDEQTLEESNSAHRRSQPKWQLVQTSYLKRVKNCSCFRHIINILLTELSRSIWENLDLGRVYRPHCVRSVLTTSVKILPYRPPARLIRAKTSNCHPSVMSFFFLIYQLFVPHFTMTVLCVYRINKQRDTSFEFSSI